MGPLKTTKFSELINVQPMTAPSSFGAFFKYTYGKKVKLMDIKIGEPAKGQCEQEGAACQLCPEAGLCNAGASKIAIRTQNLKSIGMSEAEKVEKKFGDIYVATWLHENKVVMYFSILLTYIPKNPSDDDQVIKGTCKWDGCYDFSPDGGQHYCCIGDYLAAFAWVEEQRLSRVQGAE